jgi:putative membrane protein
VIRLVAAAVVSVLASAVGLIVASLVLDDMSLDAGGFVVAVLVFAGAGVLLDPLIRQVAVKSAPALLGGTALVSTLLSLIIASVVTDGLEISGAVAWVLAALVVWLVALATRFLLPFIIFRRVFAEARAARGR